MPEVAMDKLGALLKSPQIPTAHSCLPHFFAGGPVPLSQRHGRFAGRDAHARRCVVLAHSAASIACGGKAPQECRPDKSGVGG